SEENVKCLNCHSFGESPLTAHAQTPNALAQLTAQANTGHMPETLTRAVFDNQMEDQEKFSCAICHHEHHGGKKPQTVMRSHRCQACHQGQFDRFSNGHPEFSNFPYERRTRLIFDHVSHFGKHFVDSKTEGRRPEDCGHCHHPDDAGEQMVVKRFEDVCAECHIEQIEGRSRAGAKGLPVLTVPGLDFKSLQAAGLSIGTWPEYADDSLNPFMKLLLSDTFEMRQALATLGNVDLLDLREAELTELNAAAKLAWGVKQLFHELRLRGQLGLKARLERVFGDALSNTQLAGLSGLLPAEVVSAAQLEWFPEIDQEILEYPIGTYPAIQSLPPKAQPSLTEVEEKPAPSDDEILAKIDDDILDDGNEELILSSDNEDELILADSNDDDILSDEDEILAAIDDDILTDSNDEELILSSDDGEELILADTDDDILAGENLTDEVNIETSTTPDVAPPIALTEVASEEDWVVSGGWYRQYFTLYYRPSGHADPFLFQWLSLASYYAGDASAERVFEHLAQPKGVGVCMKCHSVEETEYGLEINWYAKWPTPHEQGFNRFSHTAHFSLLDPNGCLTCHQLDAEADYEASFDNRLVTNFSSNFHPMKKGQCLQCHTPEAAGDDCLICHNYHVGQVLSKMPDTNMVVR
ncbi:MAG: hypothetical protein AAF512_09575, partial [Pseudomonadota bacterium]